MTWTRKSRTWRTRDEKIRSRLARRGTGAPLEELQPETPLERTVRKIGVMLRTGQRPQCISCDRSRMAVSVDKNLQAVHWECPFCHSTSWVDQQKFTAFLESISA